MVEKGKITEITGSGLGTGTNKTYLNWALNGYKAEKKPGICEQLIGKDATYNNVTNVDVFSSATYASNAVISGLLDAFEQERDYNKAYVGPVTSKFETLQEIYASTPQMKQVEQMIFRASAAYVGGQDQTEGFTIPASVKSISSGYYIGSMLKNVAINVLYGSGENTRITFPTGIDVTVENMTFGAGRQCSGEKRRESLLQKLHVQMCCYD